MSDIVGRLHKYAPAATKPNVAAIMEEAGVEIERLRKERDGPYFVVALQLSKSEPGVSKHSMSLHHGDYPDEETAIGHAVKFCEQEKPGFSVDQHLVINISQALKDET